MKKKTDSGRRPIRPRVQRSDKARPSRRFGPFRRFFRCTDKRPAGNTIQAVPGCGAIEDVAVGVCPICGAEGSYQPFVARQVFERHWFRDSLVGYALRDGETFIKLVRVSDLEVTREILS